MNSQPECCPFTPAASSQGVYPRPHDAKDAVVSRCPTDYYSVSGSCCPSAYTPWTAALGGATPCYSTISAATTPSPPPAGDAVAPRATRPTVTVTATVFAMRYAVTDDGAALSPGAIAGIIVGGVVLAGLVLGLYMVCCRRRRANNPFDAVEAGLGDNHEPAPGSSEVPNSRDSMSLQGLFRRLTRADEKWPFGLPQPFPESELKVSPTKYAGLSIDGECPMKFMPALPPEPAYKRADDCEAKLTRPRRLSPG
ncbi:hypothetical protein C8A01DRAFT_13595, partial [Parachaetomium inaequale]